MNRKLGFFRAAIVGAALASGLALFGLSPRTSSADFFAILLLSVLAVVAELLAYVLPNSARGSIAFIPYLACALIVPSWATVVAVAVVKAVVETGRRTKLSSTLLNMGLHALTVSVAIWAYTLLGGRSLLLERSSSLLAATLTSSVPALLAIAFSFFANISI